MCDEVSASGEAAQLAACGVSRRDFAALGAAAVAAFAAETAAGAPALVETAVEVPTPDGKADGWLIHPAAGQHPGILMWPDIAGLREAYRQMARRLAAAGYTVLVVNHYYRTARAPLLATMAEWRTPEGAAKLQPAIAAITPARTLVDARAFLAFLGQQAATDRHRQLGTCGYCMGGPYAVRTACVSARVGAVASLHGAGLVSAAPDSPHRLIAQSHARFLFAIARNDDAHAPGDKDALRAAAAAAHRPAEIEVYAADHGWCTIDAPSYNKPEAERAWGRMLALFATL